MADLTPVILVHGLERIRVFLYPVSWEFRRRGRPTHFFHYNLRKEGISSCAASLARYLEGLNTPVDLVCYSLGGVICTEMLSSHYRSSTNKIRRAVFIGSPLKGSVMALKLNRFSISKHIFGRCFEDLTRFREPPSAFPIEVGMIAGGRANESGYNPLLPGDDDCLVRVEETEVEALTEHVLLKRNHWALPLRSEVHQLTWNFLETGSFYDSTEARR